MIWNNCRRDISVQTASERPLSTLVILSAFLLLHQQVCSYMSMENHHPASSTTSTLSDLFRVARGNQPTNPRRHTHTFVATSAAAALSLWRPAAACAGSPPGKALPSDQPLNTVAALLAGPIAHTFIAFALAVAFITYGVQGNCELARRLFKAGFATAVAVESVKLLNYLLPLSWEAMHRCYRGCQPFRRQYATLLGRCCARIVCCAGTCSAKSLALIQHMTRHSFLDDACLQQGTRRSG